MAKVLIRLILHHKSYSSKACEHSMHPAGGSLRVFLAFFAALSFLRFDGAARLTHR
jgi:hypothetical protein